MLGSSTLKVYLDDGVFVFLYQYFKVNADHVFLGADPNTSTDLGHIFLI